MSPNACVIFFAEDLVSHRRLAILLPTGVICHHAAHLGEAPEFPDRPAVILAQNKDRCINRALFCADQIDKPCPVYAYADNFSKRRARELGGRGVTGLMTLSWPDALLKSALADLLARPDYEVTNFGEFGPIRLAS